MKKNIRLGIIGLGQRGDVMLENPIIPMMSDGLEIIAVCDLLPEDRTAGGGKAGKGRLFTPCQLTDYRELLKLKELDAVYIAVSWEAHVEVAWRRWTRENM